MKRHLRKIYGLTISLTYRLVYLALCHIPAFKLYQPVFGFDKSLSLTRDCEDRWEVFSKYFPEEKGSVLDIGCNLGYFTFKSAEMGHFAHGIEYDNFNITSCNAIKSVTKSDNCVFIKHLIDSDYTQTMPHFDTIINLSVFHHWVKAYGEEGAKEMMKNMADKCNCLIFETGQPNEVGSQWPKHLAFMDDAPDQWIETFLKEIGFTSVEMIGTFATGLTKTERFLFVAKK